jgi:hypothetical protein
VIFPSSMSVVQITPTTSLHDLNRNFPTFEAKVHLQSSEGDFLYAVATQADVDSDTVKFQKTQNGQAAFSFKSTSLQFTNHYLALKSAGTPANLRAQMNIQLSALTPPPEVASVSKSSSGSQVASIGVWVILLIAVLMVMRKRK